MNWRRMDDMDEAVETMRRCANILSCALAAAGANETDDPEMLVGAALIALTSHVSTSSGLGRNEAQALVYSLVTDLIHQGKEPIEATKG